MDVKGPVVQLHTVSVHTFHAAMDPGVYRSFLVVYCPCLPMQLFSLTEYQYRLPPFEL